MTNIDETTERIFRKVIFAAIKENSVSFEELLESFPTDEALILACARASDVAVVIIAQQYKGRPTSEMITRLAAYVASMNEAWSGISANDFDIFITSLLAGESVADTLPLGVAVRLPFVLAAHLVIQFKNSEETGFDYLDRVWEILETQS